MNPYYIAGGVVGALIGSVFIGGVVGWSIHRATLRRIPMPIADGIAMLLLAIGASFTNEGIGQYPAWLVYGVAAFVAYFIVQRLRPAGSLPLVRTVEPQLEGAVGAAIDPQWSPAPTLAPKKPANLAWLKRTVGGTLLTILGAGGATFIFAAVKQMVSPSLYGGSAEFSFLIGALLLIPCIFIWRGLIR